MNETSKTKTFWGETEKSVLVGRGIDIGCGTDPVLPSALPFDVETGDANDILKYVNGPFDYVYSSHCLEHMDDPRKALQDWWSLVVPGGHLFLIVPDEDLYEQGHFPSIFNPDHKATFTIGKARSWSPASINLLDLVKSLPGAEVVIIQLQDQGYDRSLQTHAMLSGRLGRILQLAYSLTRWMPGMKARRFPAALCNFLPVDQTLRYGALAQIQCIARKKP